LDLWLWHYRGLRGATMLYMPPQPLSFRWDPEFVARIDDARGDVPRSKFVRRAVEAALAGRESTESWRAHSQAHNTAVRRGSGSPSLERFKETRNGT
jgi:hypothetical protein